MAPGNGRRVVLAGDWLAEAGPMPGFPASALPSATALSSVAGAPSPPYPLCFDASGIGRWNSGLVAFLWDAKRAAAQAGLAFDPAGLPPAAAKLLGLLPDRSADLAPPGSLAGALAKNRRLNPLAWAGSRTIGVLDEAGGISVLLATTVRGAGRAALGRARMRATDLAGCIRAAGPSALLIVSVVNFLVGAILAFVGAVQLRKFAADLYVANLVGLALVREMSAVMTAIVMAGRTGGAYAARIATMQGNEEIDALTVTGIDVSEYLVLPAVLALVVTMPFLYLYGCLVGMLGGFVVAIGMLTITGSGYFAQTVGAVGLDQFVFGFGKSIAFALLIGVTSCRIGLTAGRSAADVGVAATRAVVVGIVGVIALDAVFAVIASVLDL
ncbi:MAG: MlaE family ABC transporter permease [Janthinobacterium lividum]